jgi:hypothetical protein
MIDHDDADFVIHAYGLAEAIEDGILVPLWPDRWMQMTGGKPIVASTPLHATVSEAELIEVWNGYVHWRTHVMATLPVEDQMFETLMDGQRVWVLEDGAAFTLLYPEDY